MTMITKLHGDRTHALPSVNVIDRGLFDRVPSSNQRRRRRREIERGRAGSKVTFFRLRSVRAMKEEGTGRRKLVKAIRVIELSLWWFIFNEIRPRRYILNCQSGYEDRFIIFVRYLMEQ